MAEKKDKRSAPRYVCPGTAKIDAPDAHTGQPGRICDLSIGGCLLELKKAANFKQGAPIELTIQSKGSVFRVRGTVAARKENTLIGIKFITMTERGRAELQELLSNLEQQPVSKASRAEL